MTEQNQNYKVYDFDSVGETPETIRSNARTTAEQVIPISIKTPMAINRSTGDTFVMNMSILDSIKDNFKNLLLTNHGERLGQYDFGANLMELTMELGDDAFDSEAIRRIKVACKKYLPYVSLSTFEPIVNRNDGVPGIAQVGVRITYTIPLASSAPQQIEVILYSAG